MCLIVLMGLGHRIRNLILGAVTKNDRSYFVRYGNGKDGLGVTETLWWSKGPRKCELETRHSRWGWHVRRPTDGPREGNMEAGATART